MSKIFKRYHSDEEDDNDLDDDLNMLMVARQKNIENENQRLKEELEITNNALARMINHREAYLRTIRHLHKAWAPDPLSPDSTEEDEEIKQDPSRKKLNEKIFKTMDEVGYDSSFAYESKKEKKDLIEKERQIHQSKKRKVKYK